MTEHKWHYYDYHITVHDKLSTKCECKRCGYKLSIEISLGDEPDELFTDCDVELIRNIQES